MADKYIKVDDNTVGIPAPMPTMKRDRITRELQRLEETLEQRTARIKELKEMLKVLDK